VVAYPEAIMKQLLTLITTLLIGLGVSWQTCAAEPVADISTADAIAIHSAVQSQLDALAQDDAASAFELTSPAKRMQIGTPDNFLRIIKEQYNPIYRNLGVIFSVPEIVDGEAIQVVRVTDGVSRVWVAIFWMQQEEDSSWKIDGCQLVQTTTIST
jgi:hypothetical protein